MSRQLRIEYKGALYHIMSHGTGLLWFYKDRKHFLLFLGLLKDLEKKYNFLFHTIIFMRNHYHILLETPDANLSKGINRF